MEENNLDNYFKEKLDGHTEEPSPAVWEGIDSKLPKGRFVWNKRYLILLILLLSIGGAAFFGYRLYQMDSRVARLEKSIEIEKSQTTSEPEENDDEVSERSTQESPEENGDNTEGTSPSEGQEKEQTENDLATGNDLAENPNGQNSAQTASVVYPPINSGESTSQTNRAEIADLPAPSNPNTEQSKGGSESGSETGLASSIELSRSEETQNSLNSASPTQQESRTTGTAASMAFNPTLLSSINPSVMLNPAFTIREREVDYFGQPGKEWRLFVYGMANYTHRRVVAQAEGAEAIPNRLDKAENGLITPGAGLQLSRDIGKSFRLSVGIEYNQWIQEGNYSATVPFETVELIVNTATQTSEYTFDGNISSSLGNSTFASNSADNPFESGFETLSPSSDLTFDIATRRRIDYLSIPITLEYVYNAYPFTITIGAGISVNPIIGSSSKYTIADTLPDINIRSTENISGTYLAFQAGVGLEYGVSERISLRLNPSYRGWMNPIFENEEIRTLPFGVAIRAGVLYRLGK